jgi:hypothetical protein
MAWGKWHGSCSCNVTTEQVSGRTIMTNLQTIAGAASTVMLSALLAYAALEPVTTAAAPAAPVLATALVSAHG